MSGSAASTRERHDEAAVVDREARDERAHETRNRIAERQQAEVLRAIRRRAELAGRVLRGHLEQHERHAHERRADEQRGQPGHQRRQRGADARAPIEPTSIGRRTPTRSDMRPAATAHSIGSSAYSASSTPTTAVDAPCRSASSDDGDAVAGQDDVIGDAERDRAR